MRVFLLAFRTSLSISVINLHRSQHLIYSFFIRHHNLRVTSGTFIPIDSFNPFRIHWLAPWRETCTSTRHRGSRTNKEFWIRERGRSTRIVSRTRTNWLRSSVFTDSLNSLNSGIKSDVYESGIYEHKICTRTRRIVSVYSDEMTLLLNLWLTACAQEHPSYLYPHLSPRRKSASFARPNPHSAVLPPLLCVSLSLSSLARLFGTPHFSSPFSFSFLLFFIVRPSIDASLDPLCLILNISVSL